MRRLTWMRYNHFIGVNGASRRVYQLLGLTWDGYRRQPMQRTEYYMPWGTVTVDELHKMEYTEHADWWNGDEW